MAHSTQRNDNTIAVMASRIAKCLEKRPDLTLGQMLYEALSDDEPMTASINMRRMSDTQLIEALERFIAGLPRKD